MGKKDVKSEESIIEMKCVQTGNLSIFDIILFEYILTHFLLLDNKYLVIPQQTFHYCR